MFGRFITYLLFLGYILYSPVFAVYESEDINGLNLIRWPTNSKRFAFECLENTYPFNMNDGGYPTVQEPPRPFISARFHGAYLSELNDWPRQGNLSIFPYLLHNEINLHRDFYDFVKNWRRTACAIVYDPPVGDPKIIGSGAFLGNNQVATARHNFQDIPLNNLYVRFLNYKVERTEDPAILEIHEDYFDIPVITRNPAPGGLDAGLLILDTLQEEKRLSQYAFSLPTYVNQFHTAMSSGLYASFHFAGGMPQVSVGNIQDFGNGTFLHNEAAIQAGPGASGAVLIQKNYNNVVGQGILIYRLFEDGKVNRHLISFSQMHYPDSSPNKISAPYFFNQKFQVISTNPMEVSGYEFLQWRAETHVNRRYKGCFPKPTHSVYQVEDDQRHATHHIIPIDDLLYLWDYVHTLDEGTRMQLHHQTALEAQQIRRQNYSFNRDRRWKELINIELINRYGDLHTILNALCPVVCQQSTQTGFSWSLWNLFQGWSKDYRVDDPSQQNTRDFSEKMRPNSFEQNLWDHVKMLYTTLQHLKKNPHAIQGTRDALADLNNYWQKLDRERREHLHAFNSQDWEPVGRKNGHAAYRVKVIPPN